MQQVYRYNEFIIQRTSGEYIVINTNGEYKNHSHFHHSYNAAKSCIKFVANKKIPRHSDYMIIACLRISLDEDYNRKLKECLAVRQNKDKQITKRRGGCSK